MRKLLIPFIVAMLVALGLSAVAYTANASPNSSVLTPRIILGGTDETLTPNASGQAVEQIDHSVNPDDIIGVLATCAQNCSMVQAHRTGPWEVTFTFWGANGNLKTNQLEFTWMVLGSS